MGSVRIPARDRDVTKPFVVVSDIRLDGGDRYSGGSMRIELHGDGLDAATGVFIFDFDGIDDYFNDLAANWRGWEGTKSWRSPESHLVVEATATSNGHRRLRFSLRDLPVPTWRAWVELDLEGGEEMTRVAAELVELVSTATGWR
jgi:hypothetical protein